jgi:NAD(P) transhydrogenase subunit alpha
MRPGSVIVDLAAETGGNCELTERGASVVKHGVTIIGPLNLPSSMPYHASQMWAKNLANFLALIIKDGALALNFEDDLVQGSCITHEAGVKHARVRDVVGAVD